VPVIFRPCGGTLPDPCDGLAPTITGLSPAHLTVSEHFTITGTNLDTVTEVVVAGMAAASFSILSATSIDAVVPNTGPVVSASIRVSNPCGDATGTSDILIPGLDVPPPSGDIVDIDAQWDALIHNPFPVALTGLSFRLTVSGQPVLITDLDVLATGLTVTAAQDGNDGIWLTSPFDIPPGDDFALHVTITHDDASTLAGTLDLLGELLSSGGLVLGSSTGTLTIEV
jgi:hypothetical protein